MVCNILRYIVYLFLKPEWRLLSIYYDEQNKKQEQNWKKNLLLSSEELRQKAGETLMMDNLDREAAMHISNSSITVMYSMVLQLVLFWIINIPN